MTLGAGALVKSRKTSGFSTIPLCQLLLPLHACLRCEAKCLYFSNTCAKKMSPGEPPDKSCSVASFLRVAKNAIKHERFQQYALNCNACFKRKSASLCKKVFISRRRVQITAPLPSDLPCTASINSNEIDVFIGHVCMLQTRIFATYAC